jgi:hypothetical protein
VTETDEAVLKLLANGNMTPTEIGETLWGGRRNRQAYARPAGKVLHRLQRMGKVICCHDIKRDRMTWRLL